MINLVTVIILFPLLAGLFISIAAISGRLTREMGARLALGAAVVDFIIVAVTGFFLSDSIVVSIPWIPSLGVNLTFELSGASYVLILVSAFAALLITAFSRKEISSLNYGLLLVVLGALFASLTATNLVAFYCSYELMLFPIYFILVRENIPGLLQATVKCIVYTICGSLFMLLSIVALGVLYYQQHGTISFEIADLLRISIDPQTRKFLFLGFFFAFAVKMPIVPFHTWQPAVYSKAPAPIAIFIAALLYQAGLFGLFRFGFTLFPQVLSAYSGVLSGLAVVGIVYASLLAWRSKGLRELMAYASIAHVGFSFLGLVVLQHQSISGGLFLIPAHTLIASGLFMLAAVYEKSSGGSEIGSVSGLAAKAPVFSFFMLTFSLMAISIPLTAGFSGEFLVLYGAFTEFPIIAGSALLGVVMGAVYMLGACRQILFGAAKGEFNDLKSNEILSLSAIAFLIILLGIYPAPILNYLRSDTTRAVNSAIAGRVEAYENRENFLSPDSDVQRTNPRIVKLKAE